jgi:hypothetical protein
MENPGQSLQTVFEMWVWGKLWSLADTAKCGNGFVERYVR